MHRLIHTNDREPAAYESFDPSAHTPGKIELICCLNTNVATNHQGLNMNAWLRYLLQLVIAIGVSRPVKGIAVFILLSLFLLAVSALTEGLLTLLLGPRA